MLYHLFKKQKNKIVIIDDDPSFIKLIKYKLMANYEADFYSYTDPVMALEEILKGTLQPSLIIIDLKMPKLKGTDLYNRIREQRLGDLVIIVSAFEGEDILDGTPPLLSKPINMDNLIFCIERIFDQSKSKIKEKAHA